MNLKGRSFLTLKDYTAEEIVYLLDLAADVKEKKKNGIPVDYLKGKNIALIFEKQVQGRDVLSKSPDMTWGWA